MGGSSLFDESDGAAGGREAGAAAGPARVVTAERRQIELRPCDLESLLPADHRARAVWAMVERLDLSGFYVGIRARDGAAGRPATDPKVLIALWLYATTETIGSARELARLCEEHDAYRWLRGGVPVNHHLLSDFRTRRGEALDDLLTQLLGSLERAGLLQLRRVAQDGTRVRASAGRRSFHRQKTLEECLARAREQVAAAKRAAESGDAERRERERAATERAAREREQRITQALAELEKVKAMRARQRGGKRSKGEPRASTTDPEARNMRTAAGGYQPAYNVQLATDTESRFIVGVQVTNAGTDAGLAEPMVEEIERRTGKRPDEYLVDGGYATEATIEGLSRQGMVVYAPAPRHRGVENPHAPRAGDSPELASWRQRMGSPETKGIYGERAATAETVNADLKVWRTLDRITVRGLKKVLSVALWNALAYNVLRWIALGVSTS